MKRIQSMIFLSIDRSKKLLFQLVMKGRIKFILCCVIALNASLTFAQVDVQLNTYWQNPYYITPAYINDVQSLVFTFSTRKQWVALNGSPTTFYGSVASFIENKNTQIGLRVLQNKFGYTSVTDASAVYAYNLNIGGNWWANLGLSASYQSLDYDLSKITFEGIDEPEVYANLISKRGVNADAGAEVYNSTLRFGIAGKNLVSLFDTTKTIFQNINYVYGIYKQRTKNPVDFGGGIFGIKYGNRYQIEGNVSAYFKLSGEREIFHAGALYRTPKEIGVILGANITPNLSLSYCYDYNFGFSTHRIGQTHELMLIYKLEPKGVERWDLLE